jgi:hypothetical protein
MGETDCSKSSNTATLAVLDMPERLGVESNLAAAVQGNAYFLQFEFCDRTQFTIDDPFLREWSAKLMRFPSGNERWARERSSH